MSKFKKYKIYELNVFLLMSLIVLATNKPAVAQGQDTSRSERDQQVIAALLPGEYFNANQSYFDKRTATSLPKMPISLLFGQRETTGIQKVLKFQLVRREKSQKNWLRYFLKQKIQMLQS